MKRSISLSAFALASLAFSGCGSGMTPPASSSLRPPSIGTSQAVSVSQSRDRDAGASFSAPGLSENFEADAVAGPAAGWTALAGSWTVCQKASSHEYCAGDPNNDVSVAGNDRWTDYTYDAYVIDRNPATGGGSILGRVRDVANYYELGLRAENGAPYWHLWRVRGGVETELAAGPFATQTNPYYRFRLVFSGTTIGAFVSTNFSPAYAALATVSDASFGSGNIGLRAAGNAALRYDNVLVSNARVATASPAVTAMPTASASPTATPSATPTATAIAVAKPAAAPIPVATAVAVLPSQPPSMTASSADAFVSTMGVDVDLTTPPNSQQAAIASSFAGLGVRHARISILESDPAYETNVRAFFAENPNVRAYGMTNCAPNLGGYALAKIGPADVSGFQSRTGNYLDRIESVNEPNGRNDATWVADTRTCVAPLAGGVGGVPLVAPALVLNSGGADAKALGAVSGVAMGNIHRYFAGRNPDTSGWGANDACGTYGSLAWSMCWAKLGAPGAPLVVTETGWNSQTEVDEATQAKYVERVFFVNAQAGISATSLYTFESYAQGDGFGGDGLVRTDLTPKPAYNAVANLTRVLSDPGATYRPASAHVGMAPAPVASGTGLRAMLLGKRDGSYDLALWQEVQSANPNAYGADTPPATENVTVTLGLPGQVSMDAWQNDGSTQHTSLGVAAKFSVPVTDRMTIVEFHTPYVRN